MRIKLSNRTLAAAVVAAAPYLAWSPPASAAACTVDTDCPGTTCGTEVCQWSNNDQTMMCVAAGTDPQGSDGWCDTAANCKCAGATCSLAFHCSATLPAEGGTTAESDAATTTTSDAATTTTASDAATTTTESDAATASDAATTEPESDAEAVTSSGGSKKSGCSVAAAGRSADAPFAPLGLVGLAFASIVGRKRRRS